VTEPAADPLPRRRHERVEVEAEVTLRRTGKLNFRVSVYDVSPDGCRAEFVDRPELGERVWIKFDGMHSLEAQICWVAGPKTGMRFVQPIHAAVFGTLIARLRGPCR